MSAANQEIKRISRDRLNGNYRLVMGAFLFAYVVTAFIELPFSNILSANPNAISNKIISVSVEFLVILLGIVLLAGQFSLHLKIARGETKKLTTRHIFTFFRNQPDRFLLAGLFLLFMYGISLAPALVAVFLFPSEPLATYIGAILAGCSVSLFLLFWVQLHYSLVLFLLVDQADLSVMAAISNSCILMKGHKWALFRHLICFAGYDLLCILSFGLGCIWAIPYQMQVLCNFYLDVTGQLPDAPYINCTIS